MTADLMAHWVRGGSPADARKYGLTLKAACGAVFTVGRKVKLSDKMPCPACEAIDGPIPGAKGNESVQARSDAPVGRPRIHYVYRCYDADGDLLYVGCSVDLATRRLGHNANSWWFPKVDHWRVTVFPNKMHAHRIERDAIRHEQPLCNTRHQDFSAWTQERLEKARDFAIEMSAAAFAARLTAVAGAR